MLFRVKTTAIYRKFYMLENLFKKKEPEKIYRYVVIYDIAIDDSYDSYQIYISTQRRSRVVFLLLEHGIRVQKSVFEVEVKSSEFFWFVEALKRAIDPEKDKLYIYPLDEISYKKIKRYGNIQDTILSDLFI